ncbi:Hypothetical protein NAEGRDRAFT_80184 [Naegleria gruberi]|uniref:RWP-RK domain-containing protein n=1 Tax=Naegleria gruberi TaxID=5762 RepID=D2VJF1_NAEGR|nr:uncharacterized protein NAEGRDRAFT_80184 [Naegleria gruberi]EFC42932.1 Hypothetical protein NAEGRDRAFT_80184 [Naegleria gruberi]|eukprot:XP_002675676.1 Hypothetical protein NAEGRDRAFT_80184 [Naegleria gruberi strain NEG-M]
MFQSQIPSQQLSAICMREQQSQQPQQHYPRDALELNQRFKDHQQFKGDHPFHHKELDSLIYQQPQQYNKEDFAFQNSENTTAPLNVMAVISTSSSIEPRLRLDMYNNASGHSSSQAATDSIKMETKQELPMQMLNKDNKNSLITMSTTPHTNINSNNQHATNLFQHHVNMQNNNHSASPMNHHHSTDSISSLNHNTTTCKQNSQNSSCHIQPSTQQQPFFHNSQPINQETQPQQNTVQDNSKNRPQRRNSNSSCSPKKRTTFGMSNHYQQQHVGGTSVRGDGGQQSYMPFNASPSKYNNNLNTSTCGEIISNSNGTTSEYHQFMNNNYSLQQRIETSSRSTTSLQNVSPMHAQKSVQVSPPPSSNNSTTTFNIQQEKIKKPRKTIKRKYQFKNVKSGENVRSNSSSPSSPSSSQNQHSNDSKCNSIETVSYYTTTDGKELDLTGYYQHQLQYTTFDFYNNSSVSIVKANPTFDVKSFKRSVDSISKDELLRVLHLTQQQASTILGCSVSTIKRRFYGLRNELGLTKWPNNYFEYSHMKLFEEIYPLSLNFILNKGESR